MNNPEILLVKGYHYGTPVPEQCQELGLGFRFAVILQTFVPGHDYGWLGLQVIQELVRELMQNHCYDALSFTLENKMRFVSLETYAQYVHSNWEKDDSRVSDIHFIEFMKEGNLSCFMAFEQWYLFGGPALDLESPYSDSYTFAFYTAQDMSKEFTAICETVCLKLNVAISKRIEGESSPVHWGLFKRILKNIKYDFQALRPLFKWNKKV